MLIDLFCYERFTLIKLNLKKDERQCKIGIRKVSRGKNNGKLKRTRKALET